MSFAAWSGSLSDSRNCAIAASTASSETAALPLKNWRRAASLSWKASANEAWSALNISGGRLPTGTAPGGNMASKA